MSEMMLEVKQIKKSFQIKEHPMEVLKGIDLQASQGEFVTLLGASGCGKTTMLRIIAGLETADEGNIILQGRDITALPPNQRGVNTVFQNYALFPHMTVAENVAYGLKVARIPKPERLKKAEEMLELVQLEGFGKRKVTELSGGQRQRVAIARAIIREPRVVLLDEPLGALDYKLRKQMQLELKHLQKRLGMTFIYITHDQEEAINMSDRIGVMHDGVLEQIGTPNDIYYHPQTSYVADFVGNANIYRKQGMTYAIRSENVRIRQDAEVSFLAHVVEKSFSGGQLRIVFTLEDGQQILASRSGIDYDVAVGEAVKIGWNKQDAVLVKDNMFTERDEVSHEEK